MPTVLITRPAETDALIEFLWQRKFLAIRESPTRIAVSPGDQLLPRAALFRLRRHLTEWNRGHRDAEACVMDEARIGESAE